MESFELSEFFKTQSEAKDFKDRMTLISEMIFQEDFNLEKALMDQLGLHRKERFMALLRGNGISVDSRESLKDFLIKLQENISSIPVISLTLAFEPREETLAAVSEWFVLNLKKQVLLDLKKDPKIIAGAAIYFNGKYMDFSIKEKFTEVLQKVLSGNINQQKETSPPPPHQSTEHFVLGRY